MTPVVALIAALALPAVAGAANGSAFTRAFFSGRPGGTAVAESTTTEVFATEDLSSRWAVYAPDGSFKRSKGSGPAGSSGYDFSHPTNLALGTDASNASSQHLLVADTNNNRISEFRPSDGQFEYAWGKGVTSMYGDSPDRCYGICVAGEVGTGDGQFDHPRGVAVSGGELYVADAGNHRIQVFTLSSQGGTYARSMTTTGLDDSRPFTPVGVAVSGGKVYAVDQYSRIVTFDAASGIAGFSFGTQGSGAGQLSAPQGNPAILNGRLLVADTGNDRISIFDAGTGAFVRSYGAGVNATAGATETDACATACQAGSGGNGAGHLESPAGLSVSSIGEIFVADTWNNRISVFTPDLTAPQAPSALSTTPASPAKSGTPTVKGTAEAGSTVRVYATADCSGAAAATGTAAGFANPGLEVTAAEGATSFTATATDPSGNVSSCSAAYVYSRDNTPPAVPTNLATNPASPSPSYQPKITGTAEPGSTVTVSRYAGCSVVDASASAAVFASPGIAVNNQNFSPNTTYSYYVTVTDAAGNVSPCTGPITYRYDPIAPGAPTNLTTDPAGSGQSHTLRVKGSAESGSTVRLHYYSNCSDPSVGTGSAEEFSSPGIQVTIPDGYTAAEYYADTTDAAGNLSACSSSHVHYQVDTTPPAAPTDLASDRGVNDKSHTPAISGSAESASTVRVYTNADCTSAVVATGPASTFQSPGLTVTYLADESTTTFYATATDVAGNVSACSSSHVTYHQDSPPAAPSGLAVTPASGSSERQPSISGTAQAGGLVFVYATATCTGTAVAVGASETFASPGLRIQTQVASGSTTTFSAKVEDGGGDSPCSTDTVTYTHAPPPVTEAPTGLTVASSGPNDLSPKVKGTAPAGSSVSLFKTADCSGTPITADADAFATGLGVTVPADATTFFSAKATKDGSTSACSASTSYTHKTAAPTGLTTDPPSPSQSTTPKVKGTATADVKLFDNATCTGLPVATGTAAQFADPGLAVSVPSGGTRTFRATAGGSACSDPVSYTATSATTAPTATTQTANVTQTTATLSGLVSPADGTTTASFEYGGSSALGQTTPKSVVAAGGNGSQQAVITGLQPGTTYFFRMVAVQNGYPTAHGEIVSFTTTVQPQQPQQQQPSTTTPAGTSTKLPTPTTTVAPPAAHADLALPPTTAKLTGKYAAAVTAPGAGILTVTWSKGRTVLAKGKATSPAAGAVKVTLKLTAKGKKAVKKAKKAHKPLKLTVKATFTGAGGAVTRTSTVTLKP